MELLSEEQYFEKLKETAGNDQELRMLFDLIKEVSSDQDCKLFKRSEIYGEKLSYYVNDRLNQLINNDLYSKYFRFPVIDVLSVNKNNQRCYIDARNPIINLNKVTIKFGANPKEDVPESYVKYNIISQGSYKVITVPASISFLNGSKYYISAKLEIEFVDSCLIDSTLKDSRTTIIGANEIENILPEEIYNQITRLWSFILKAIVLFVPPQNKSNVLSDPKCFWEWISIYLQVKDYYTYNHCLNVRHISCALINKMETEKPIRLDHGDILLGMFMHDLGKAVWPQYSFSDIDDSRPDEFAAVYNWIKSHPITGAVIFIWLFYSQEQLNKLNNEFDLKNIPIALIIILFHHFKAKDGSFERSYPTSSFLKEFRRRLDTKKKEEERASKEDNEFLIQLSLQYDFIEKIVGKVEDNYFEKESENSDISERLRVIKIACVADCFSAISEKRQHKPAFPISLVKEELQRDEYLERHLCVTCIDNLAIN